MNGQILQDIVRFEQDVYEIRIGTSSSNWGSWSFIGDVFQSDFVITKDQRFIVPRNIIDRGIVYYGQLQIRDEKGEWSVWQRFTFSLNELPEINNAYIYPSNPSIVDNLQLNYILSGSASSVVIKWFQNSIYQQQFDNVNKIDSSYIVYGDIWFAEITPINSQLFGDKFITSSVAITSIPPISSDLEILPDYPNENDILKADYIFTDTLLEQKSTIKWYVNNVLQQTIIGSKYVRLNVNPGDIVFCSVTPCDGVSCGNTVTSAPIAIQYSKFIIDSIFMDNILVNSGGFDLSSIYFTDNLTPIIRWNLIEPKNKNASYLSLKIGKYPINGDIYSTVLNISNKINTFTVPQGIINTGGNYYISISASDNQQFENYTTTYFKVDGSVWNNSVSNATGWTIEVDLKYPYPNISGQVVSFDDSNFHSIRMSDGSKFAEVRIYNNTIGLFTNQLYLSNIITTNQISQDFDSIVISGQGNNIKVYLNDVLMIDGTGLMTVPTADISLSINVFGSLSISYKGINYTTTGSFASTDSNFIYSGYVNLINIKNEEIIGLSKLKTSDIVVNNINLTNYRTFFATTPFNEGESSSIYEILNGTAIMYPAAGSTFNPINKISSSSDNSNIFVGHTKGFLVIENNPIKDWDYSSIFDGNFDINSIGFDRYSNTRCKSSYLQSDGLYIMTTWASSQNCENND